MQLRFVYIIISSVRRDMKWQIYVTLMAKMVIFSLKRVAALHESTFLCSAAIVVRHACPSCLSLFRSLSEQHRGEEEEVLSPVGPDVASL